MLITESLYIESDSRGHQLPGALFGLRHIGLRIKEA